MILLKIMALRSWIVNLTYYSLLQYPYHLIFCLWLSCTLRYTDTILIHMTMIIILNSLCPLAVDVTPYFTSCSASSTAFLNHQNRQFMMNYSLQEKNFFFFYNNAFAIDRIHIIVIVGKWETLDVTKRIIWFFYYICISNSINAIIWFTILTIVCINSTNRCSHYHNSILSIINQSI